MGRAERTPFAPSISGTSVVALCSPCSPAGTSRCGAPCPTRPRVPPQASDLASEISHRTSRTPTKAATESKNPRQESRAAARGPPTRRRHRYILQVYINGEATMETAKLFMNGRSQAVRLPKGFRFEGEEVFIKKVGNAVVLLPRQRSWETLYESLESFSEDFMEERGQPVAGQERAEAPFD